MLRPYDEFLSTRLVNPGKPEYQSSCSEMRGSRFLQSPTMGRGADRMGLICNDYLPTSFLVQPITSGCILCDAKATMTFFNARDRR